MKLQLACRRKLLRFILARRLVEQPLIVLKALCGCAANDGRDGAPLRRHQLCEVQQLLFLVSAPLRLLDRRVKPLVPSRLRLAMICECLST